MYYVRVSYYNTWPIKVKFSEHWAEGLYFMRQCAPQGDTYPVGILWIMNNNRANGNGLEALRCIVCGRATVGSAAVDAGHILESEQ